MNHGIIISLATLDLILGILLYVTIRQIQIIDKTIESVDQMACEAKKQADLADIKANRHEVQIRDIYEALTRSNRNTNEVYKLAAECRNELVRNRLEAKGETKDVHGSRQD